MRKLVCLLAVAMFAAPAFGGDITFTVYDDTGTDGQFRIGYEATTDAPSAFALWVTLSGSCTGTVSGLANVVSSSSEFDVHIDYASDDPCNYTIGMGGQHPLADPCQAGTPTGAVKFFSVVQGRLDPCNPAPLIVSNLVTIDVDFSSGCTLNVDIEADNLRGGVVGAAYDSVTMVDGTVTLMAVASGPPCWSFDSQCYGDFDNDEDVDGSDWPTFRDSFGRNYCEHWNGGAGPYNPCADLDQDGDVDGSDWPGFRDNFGTSNAPDDCPMAGIWPPTCP